MSTTYEAKQNAKLEAEAKRRGLQPWQVDAAEAVDDTLVADLVADGRRSSPMAPTPTVPSEPSRIVYADLPEDIKDVLLAGGLNLRALPQGAAAMAQGLLREGLSVGAAGAIVFKAFRWA
jgi:hypothetical protein